jgi:hypothetical protein
MQLILQKITYNHTTAHVGYVFWGSFMWLFLLHCNLYGVLSF